MDESKLHFVRLPKDHIVIDIDHGFDRILIYFNVNPIEKEETTND